MSAFSSPWFKAGLGAGLLALALWAFLSALQDAYDIGHRVATSAGAAAISSLESKHAQEAAETARRADASAKAAAKNQAELQTQYNHLASKLADQQRAHRATTDRLIGEIARVNDLYRESLDAPPKPLPACVFTAGFVRVWDEATGARAHPVLPATADSGRAAAQVDPGQAADQLDAGISQSVLLAHHVQYAEQCRNTADQLDALIDAVQGKH